ncbi:MAG: 3-phenylpropionate/cinnamic acid dioxygenase subunit beta [Chloroflexi bacterium]|nr:3-phenylpropionate/cinnamic acid dioxygenase subunit beta [Chloroflexota bacterium]
MAELLSNEELRLRLEVEDFLYNEADLLDEHRYEEWLDLFTEDARYYAPMKRNVSSKEMDRELTAEVHEMSWFDEGKDTLKMRVAQIRTNVHWAEEPLSRVSHFVSNVRLLDSSASEVGPAEIRVKCRFLIYRNRREDEEDTWIGKRVDTLRKVDGHWKISRREIYIDQNVMLSKNLTNFF